MSVLLSPRDYENMLHFASAIALHTDNIRSNIQNELARQFGYNDSIFWKLDHDGQIYDPQLFGLQDQILEDYLNEYSHQDFLHPSRNRSLFRAHGALRLSDLIDFNSYENSSFYRSFMKPYGYYDEMVISLSCEGRYVGVIGLARKAHEDFFSEKDRKRFQLISGIIGATFSRHQTEDCSLLSKRENEVAKLVKLGNTNIEIAAELHISPNTVKKHLQNIYQKHGVSNRTQLVKELR